MAFQIITKNNTSKDFVAQHVITLIAMHFESNDSDKVEPHIKDIQDAYQVIYNNWLNVYMVNKSIKERIMEITEKNDKKSGCQL